MTKKKEEKKETPTCAQGMGTYNLSYYEKNGMVSGLKINVNPLNMKNLLVVCEDLYTQVVQLNSKVSEKTGYLQGEYDAIIANQKTLYSRLMRVENELNKLIYKPWWKRFLGL